jgi:RNA-directed DNA polymerase
MKRANYLYEHILELNNLRLAFWKASKGKRYSNSVLAYQADLEQNMEELQSQLRKGIVQVGDYRYFKVYEPKERQICASAFREQVLHHALMNICHPIFERAQIFDSYASRKEKGTYAALERAKGYSRKYTWYLKLDVKKFFESIHHDVVKNQLVKLFKEQSLLLILFQIIDSYEASPDRGLPIGNLTSQYLANQYLCGLDHFVKEQLLIPAYVRYMDDMVLWSDDKEVLQAARHAIHEYIENQLRCELKPIMLNKVSQGLPFLGYHIFPDEVRLLQKSKQRFIRKYRQIEQNYQAGVWSEAICQRRILPLLAFIEHANARGFRKAVYLKLHGQVS